MDRAESVSSSPLQPGTVTVGGLVITADWPMIGYYTWPAIGGDAAVFVGALAAWPLAYLISIRRVSAA